MLPLIMVVAVLLVTACSEVNPGDTPGPLPGAAPGAPGPGVGGATSPAPPVRSGSRHN